MSKTEVRQFNTCTRSPFNAVVVLLLILQTSIKTSDSSSSCKVSRLTLRIVEDCPDSKEKWREAAAKKNCTTYASQCDEPERLVYHCVLNAYINQTLEVCAYPQFIVLGYCTYYSELGNLILPRFRTTCTYFLKNPCPQIYLSTEAYKYQGCYELTKKSGKHVEGITQIDSFAVTSASTVSTVNWNEKEDDEKEDEAYKAHIIVIVFLAILLVFTCCIVLLFCYRIAAKYNRLKSYGNG